MNPPKYHENEYINFLIASPRVFSCTEAARAQPERENTPAHDAITRLLHRLELGSAELWSEASGQVDRKQGVLVLDDSTLDKQYAKQIELVTRHWSGKHHRVVSGINLISLLWSEGERYIPCDYRLYDKEHDGLSKNDHFQAMLATAKQRGFEPECVIFDSWYNNIQQNRRAHFSAARKAARRRW